MDIWGWVEGRYKTLTEEGHDELASLIYDISHYACDDRSDLVDQIFHRALPLCRALEDHWLELYFRHWRLQAHVLKSYRAKDLLPEAVSLLEFSHREEAKECPQRICAVQDLAACYGIKDGPGFAEERIAVCQETISQIDGSWPCFGCINNELLDALMDAEKYDELQDELSRIDAELGKHKDSSASELLITRGRLLLRTGQVEKARNLVEKAENPGGGSGFIRSQKLMLALIYCAEKRWPEAHKLASEYSVATLDCKYLDDWTDAQFQLAIAGLLPNDRSLRQNIHQAAQSLEQNGALRVSFRVLDRLLRLCVVQEESFRAGFVTEAMERLSSQFNRDMGASKRLSELEQSLAGIRQPMELPVFSSAEELLEYEFENETAEFEALKCGLEKWPDNTQCLLRKCALLDASFQNEKSYELLAQAYSADAAHPLLEHEFGRAFLNKEGFDEYAKVFPFSQLESMSKEKLWNRGFIHFRYFENRNPDRAFEVLRTIETYWPNDASLIGNMASHLTKNGEFKEALSYRLKQSNLEPENTDVLWDICIAATLAEDTQALAKASEQLQLNLTPEGMFEEDEQPSMRLQLVSENGGTETFYATRIGPVLARINSISNLHAKRQVYRQEVVFDPAPLNSLTEIDEEGHACDKEGYYNHLYPGVSKLRDPKFRTFAIDGVDPGAEATELLRQQIEAAGFVYNRRSGDRYRIKFSEDGVEQEKQGLYAYVLADPKLALDPLNQLLLSFNRTLDHPLVWTHLCEEIGDLDTLKKQIETCEKYGITDE